MFCDWIFDASGHGGFCYADHISVNRPICFVFYPFRVTVDIWLDGMVSFFDRINLVQSHLFDWTASIQVTVSSSIYRCIFIEICVTVFLSPRNIQRYCFIIPILIYTDVREWLCWSERTIMCVCVFAYMFLLLLRVGTHHYRLTTNWNGWKRVLYILLLLLLMLFVNNYTIERNSNSMTTNYNDVGEWNGTVREKKHTFTHQIPSSWCAGLLRSIRFASFRLHLNKFKTYVYCVYHSNWDGMTSISMLCLFFFSFKQI